jgi:hypothetical protein
VNGPRHRHSRDDGRSLAFLFAWLTDFLRRLAAVQAFAAIAFQTLWVSVISLDLTGIIAFDTVVNGMLRVE